MPSPPPPHPPLYNNHHHNPSTSFQTPQRFFHSTSTTATTTTDRSSGVSLAPQRIHHLHTNPLECRRHAQFQSQAPSQALLHRRIPVEAQQTRSTASTAAVVANSAFTATATTTSRSASASSSSAASSLPTSTTSSSTKRISSVGGTTTTGLTAAAITAAFPSAVDWDNSISSSSSTTSSSSAWNPTSSFFSRSSSSASSSSSSATTSAKLAAAAANANANANAPVVTAFAVTGASASGASGATVPDLCDWLNLSASASTSLSSSSSSPTTATTTSPNFTTTITRPPSSSTPPSSSHLSSHRADACAFSSLGSIMDPSQFGDFSFQYDSLPMHDPHAFTSDQSTLLSAATKPSSIAPFDDLHGADLSSLQSSAQTPSLTTSTAPTTHHSASSFAMDPADLSANVDDIFGIPDDLSPDASSILHPDNALDDFASTSQDRADGTDLGGRGAGAKDDKGDGAPAWSELKTKAGKDRKRLPLACIACRRKKIRCSGEKPACKHCLRSRIPCVYKVTSRKAAPRTDYMAMLDKRLKRMEERIIKIVPKAEQDPNATTPTVTRAVVKPAIPGAAASKGAKKRRADEAFDQGLDTWINGPANGKDASAKPSSEERNSDDDSLAKEGAEALPPRDIQEHLSEVFFDNIYGQPYYLLHKPSYMRKLKNNTLPPVLVLSVCAVAARFSTSPKLATNARPFLRGEEWASHAREICTKRYEWPNLTVLTCLILLAVNEFGTCHGGRSWALGGQAIRMAYALQLHKNLEYDPLASGDQKVKLSFIDREIRRRTMWACFLLDRFTSSTIERPAFINEESIEVPLPVNERFFEFDMPIHSEYLDGRPAPEPTATGPANAGDTASNLGIAAYMVRAVAGWGRALAYINGGGRASDPEPAWSDKSRFSALIRENEEMVQRLPAEYQWSKDNLEVHVTEKTAPQYLLLHTTIPLITVFLNQGCASALQASGVQDAPKEFLAKTSARTFAAASRISQVLREGDEGQIPVNAAFAGYSAFTSTSVQLLAMASASPQLKTTAEANCSINVKYMRRLMRHWGMFHWMVEDIRRQYKTSHDVARKGSAGAAGPIPPLLQYGDWFQQYPYGIADSDMMDPSVGRKHNKGEDGVLELKSELQSVEDFFSTLSPVAPNSSELANKPAPKRKASTATKKQASAQQNDVKASADQQQQQQLQLKRRASEQVVTTQNQPSALNAAAAARRFSSPQGPQKLSTPQNSQLFNNPTMGPQTNSFMAMSPTVPQYQTQVTPNLNYFTDVIPLPMNNQDAASIAAQQQAMYTMAATGSMTPNMDSSPTWARQPNSVMTPGANGQQVVNTNMYNTGAAGAGAGDASTWFIPYDVEAGDMGSQDMMMSSASNMDPFDSMFMNAQPSTQGQNMTVPARFPNM